MPPAAAALLPHPPLLVPSLAGGAAAELDPLRSACRQALDAVIAAASTVVLIGDGHVWGVPEPSATGSFRPYGGDLQVALPAPVGLDLTGLPEPARPAHLPLSLAVAAYLLADLDPRPLRLFAATVPATLGPGAAASIGRTIVAAIGPGAGPGHRADRAGLVAAPDPGRSAGAGAGAGAPVGLVVMGDLSACRTEWAPGGFRPEAAAFDASVAEAFRSGEPKRLLDLDPAQAVELLAAGRAPLQVLAGAVEHAPPMRGRILYEDAPYGVGYLVALLTAP